MKIIILACSILLSLAACCTFSPDTPITAAEQGNLVAFARNVILSNQNLHLTPENINTLQSDAPNVEIKYSGVKWGIYNISWKFKDKTINCLGRGDLTNPSKSFTGITTVTISTWCDEESGMTTNNKKILLHVCCAPCSAGIILRLIALKTNFSVIFYNPNIDTETEYNKRKREVQGFCKKNNVPCIDLDYDEAYWRKEILGLESEPEKGKRCSVCFSLRLKKCFHYAQKHDFNAVGTTLTISRFKSIDQIHECAKEIEKQFDDIEFLDVNWRKCGGSDYAEKISKLENFYKQNYCGCAFSKKTLAKELS